MRNSIVRTQSLKKYYKVGNQIVKALDGVDFEVQEQEFVAIIGKSGSGKSTLLHMIGGLDTPTDGTVIVDGMNLEKMNHEQLALFRRRKVGFIFQQYNLIPDLNIYDNIIFPLELDGAQIDTNFIEELLETLNIADKKKCFRPCFLEVNSKELQSSGRWQQNLQLYLLMSLLEIWTH